MSESDFLEKIAQDKNWLSFAASLSSAVRDPMKYGFANSERLVEHVAALRGAEPSSLRNPLNAYSWLESHAPKALELDGKRVPMTGVITLSQIWELSGEVGKQTASNFLKGKITRKDLKSILKDLQDKKGGIGVRAHERVKSSAAFEEQVYDYLKENIEVFGLWDNVEVVRSGKDAPLPSDLIVLFKDEPVAAIEIKSHRHKKHHRYLVETVAMAAFLANEYHESILIVPSSWGDSISEMSDLISRYKQSRVILAVFDDQADADPRNRLRLLKESGLPFIFPQWT